METSGIDEFLTRRLAEQADFLEAACMNGVAQQSVEPDKQSSRAAPAPAGPQKGRNEFERCNPLVSFSVYLTWVILMVMAHFRELLRKYGVEKNLAAVERPDQRVGFLAARTLPCRISRHFTARSSRSTPETVTTGCATSSRGRSAARPAPRSPCWTG